jgi:hypothetical protein
MNCQLGTEKCVFLRVVKNGHFSASTQHFLNLQKDFCIYIQNADDLHSPRHWGRPTTWSPSLVNISNLAKNFKNQLYHSKWSDFDKQGVKSHCLELTKPME